MNNPIGMHSSLWWGTPIGSDICEIIRYTAKTTADYIDINPDAILPLSKEKRSDLRKLADDCGIKVLINGGIGSGCDLASEDPQVRKTSMERAYSIVDAVADMDVTVWSGCMHAGYLQKPCGGKTVLESKERGRRTSIESMRILLAYAAEKGITLMPEQLNRYEQYIINTAADGVSYCDETGCDNIRILLDAYHMNIEEDDMFEAICYAQAHDKIGYIHIGEANRRVPTGVNSCFPWKKFADTLRKCGYTGVVMVEPFEFSTTPNAYRVCTWKDRNDPTDLNGIMEHGRKGVEYLRSL